MLGGPARLKRRVAQSSKLDVAFLPYRQPLIESLRACRERPQVVLAGPADAEMAETVAKHLGVFDAVHVTDAAAVASTSDALVAAYPQGFRLRGPLRH